MEVEDSVELLLMATPLHLGLEPLHALGQAADVGVSCLVVLHLSLVDLLVVLLHVSQELLGGAELPVQPGLLAGVAGVLLLTGLDPDLPPVDLGEMAVEMRLLGEGGRTVRTVQPDLLVDTLHVAGEVPLLPEALATRRALKALQTLVDSGHVPSQGALLSEGQAAAQLRADEGDSAVDGVNMAGDMFLEGESFATLATGEPLARHHLLLLHPQAG